MKTLKCDLCDHEETAETFEEWMNKLKPHYFKDHADVMKDPKNRKEQQQRWMIENKARFENA